MELLPAERAEVWLGEHAGLLKGSLERGAARYISGRIAAKLQQALLYLFPVKR